MAKRTLEKMYQERLKASDTLPPKPAESEEQHRLRKQGHAQLAKLVFEYCKLNDLPEKQLAAKIPISQSALSRWLVGERNPTLEDLINLCKALDASPDLRDAVLSLFGYPAGPAPIYISQEDLHRQHEAAQAAERQQRLRALLLDQSSFINNWLANFVGRENELANIRARIAKMLSTGGYITITGPAGQGKSSVIAKLVEEYGRKRTLKHFLEDEDRGQSASELPDDIQNIAHHFIPTTPTPGHQSNLLRNLMARLILKHNLTATDVVNESDRAALSERCFPSVLTELTAKGGQDVIFIDGLDQLKDEGDGKRDLSFLPKSPPVGVVFVLGTRPNDTLDLLEGHAPRDEYELPDLSRIDFDHILEHRLEPAMLTSVRPLANRFYDAMQHNALYLDLVAKEMALRGATAPEELIQQIEDNPDNLFSFIVGPGGRLSDDRDWERVGLPILRFLLVAQQPLSDLALHALIIDVGLPLIRRGISKLGGLVVRDDSTSRYYLFHIKLQEYLQRDLFAETEISAAHRRLIDWCERDSGGVADIWQDAPDDMPKQQLHVEQERRNYARHNYITQLAAAKDWAKLWSVLDEGSYGRDKLRYDLSGRSYALDLDIGRQAVIDAASGDVGEGVRLLPNLWRYSLLRCNLTSQADDYTDSMFEALVWLRRELEAIDRAELLTDPKHKARILAKIGVLLGQQAGSNELRRKLLFRVIEITCAINDLPSRTETLTKIAIALAQAGRLDQATHMLDQALATARQIDDQRLRGWALAEIATALAQAGRPDQALATARQIDDQRLRPEVLTEIATALAQAGRLDQATHMLDLALAITQHIDDRRRRAEALAKVATALTQAGRLDQATHMLDQVLPTARGIFYYQEHAEALAKVATTLTQAGRLDQATHMFDQALAATRQIWYDQERAEALAKVATALTQAGRLEQATHMLDLALATAQHIDERWRRAEALAKVAIALAQAGRLDQATHTLDQALAITQHIDDKRVRSEALAKVAIALAQVGRLDQALATAQHIDDKRVRSEALAKVAIALAQAGRLDQALATAQQIDEQWRRAEALAKVATALAQAGRLDQATHMLDQALATAQYIDYQRAHAKALTETLTEIAIALTQTDQHEKLLTMIQQYWATMPTSEYMAAYAALALPLIGMYPDLATQMVEAFTWVDQQFGNS